MFCCSDGRHLIELYLWAAKAGVSLRSVQDDATCENLIMAAVMWERTAEDSLRKSLAVAAGMERRARSGKATGGPRPYGFHYAADGSGLEVVPAETEVVRRIFAEFLAGRSVSAIARLLQQDGVPTLRGGLWRQSTISGVLRNIPNATLGAAPSHAKRWAPSSGSRQAS